LEYDRPVYERVSDGIERVGLSFASVSLIGFVLTATR